jgi:hypothetical protein
VRPEHLRLRRARRRTAFDEVKFDGLVKIRKLQRGGVENIAGKPTVSRTSVDQIEPARRGGVLLTERLAIATREILREAPAEEGSHVDARVEIATPS